MGAVISLTLFFQMFPFDPLLITFGFCCYQDGQKGTLGRKGFIISLGSMIMARIFIIFIYQSLVL